MKVRKLKVEAAWMELVTTQRVPATVCLSIVIEKVALLMVIFAFH